MSTSNPNAKLFSVLAYVGILWIVGLLAAKDDLYVKYHVNQGLILFLVSIAGSIIGVIPVVGTIISMIVGIFTFVCFVLGILNAVRGDMKPLPIIGKYELLK